MRPEATSRLANLPVWVRLARPNERLDLEELQYRASRALPEYRAQLEANPEALHLPMEHIQRGAVIVDPNLRQQVPFENKLLSPGRPFSGCTSYVYSASHLVISSHLVIRMLCRRIALS